jgi:hypothetical protein
MIGTSDLQNWIKVAIFGLACGFTGWLVRSPSAPEVRELVRTEQVQVEVEKVVWRDREVVKTQWRDRVVVRKERETKPDGTTREVETVEKEGGRSDTVTAEQSTEVGLRTEKKQTSTVDKSYQLPAYFVSGAYGRGLGLGLDGEADAGFLVGGGVRLGRTPFWLTAHGSVMGGKGAIYVGGQLEW